MKSHNIRKHKKIPKFSFRRYRLIRKIYKSKEFTLEAAYKNFAHIKPRKEQ